MGEQLAIQLKQMGQEPEQGKALEPVQGQSQRVVEHHLAGEFVAEWMVLAIHQWMELAHNAWAQNGECDLVIYLVVDPSGKMGMQQVKLASGHHFVQIF